MAYWRHNYHNLMNSTRRRRVDSDSMAENWPNASHSNQLWIYLHSKEGSKDGAVARGFAPYQVQWPVEFSGFCSLHKNQHLQIPILPRRRTVQPPKWSRPRKDPQPWNDPQGIKKWWLNMGLWIDFLFFVEMLQSCHFFLFLRSFK